MTLSAFNNQHLIHMNHLDPQLGKVLVKFLQDSDPSHFGSLSYPRHEIDKNISESMEKFEKAFFKVLNHIESSDLVLTWNRQDMISNIKVLNSFVSDDTLLVLLDIEWTKQLLCYSQFVYHSKNEYIKSHKLLLAIIGLTVQPDLILAAYWGMLQCNILLKDWNIAWSNIIFINELLSSKGDAFSPVNIHLNREWLMTAALFILSAHPDGSSLGAEFFMQSSQLNTILCGCQYLFRYAISFVLMSRKKKSFIKELFKFMQHESLKSLNDPIIKLFHTCLIAYNFEPARGILENWKQTIKLDYFLHSLESELLDGTRTIVFDTYCKLHKQIQIDSMVHRLYLDNGYSENESEVWIVKAIQKSKIDAKIDSENGVILIQSKHPIPYHHVIEKTKSQNLRTQMMAIHLNSVSTTSNVTRS